MSRGALGGAEAAGEGALWQRQIQGAQTGALPGGRRSVAGSTQAGGEAQVVRNDLRREARAGEPQTDVLR